LVAEQLNRCADDAQAGFLAASVPGRGAAATGTFPVSLGRGRHFH